MVPPRPVSLLLALLAVSVSARWVSTPATFLSPPRVSRQFPGPYRRDVSGGQCGGGVEGATVGLVDDGQEVARAQRLGGAIRIPTVSYDVPSLQDNQRLTELHDYIVSNYPLIHSSPFVTREVTDKKSLLYTVTGSRPGMLPFMLCSHLDVVPANPATWEVPPFSGEIVNNTFIYGRGTIDDKGGVFGILEAVEFMLKKSGQPQRTFFMAFGHDEEIGGKGAASIADLLKSKGIDRLDFISDEGHPITHNLFPGTDKNVALVGISEKGILTVNLTVRGTPGHSSMPPNETAIGILAAAVARLEQNKPPSMLGQGPERYTFACLAPYASPFYQNLYSNLDENKGLLSSLIEKNPVINPMIRTTTALTVFSSGIKANVVPAFATALVNHRIHPSQTVADILEFDRTIINDPRVNIAVFTSREPSPVSPFERNAPGYQVIKNSIEQAFPDTVVVPGTIIANTDTQHYLGFTSQIYRFFPTVAELADLPRYHGNNERISIQNYGRAVNFYYRVIRNAELAMESAGPYR